MPSAQVIDINPPPAPSSLPTPSHEDLPKWIRIWLWWKHHQFISVTVLCVVAAAASIGIVSFHHPSQLSNSPSSTTSSPTPTPSSDSAQRAQENAFYATMPESLLYYSYTQTTDSQNIFQSDPTNDHRRGITIGLATKYLFATSPDGTHLLRWTTDTIEVSEASNLEHFSQIYKSSKPDLRISSVIWSTDSSQIAFILSRQTNDQTGGLGPSFENVLFTMPLGQPAHQVFDQTKLFTYHLLALTAPTKLYYAEDKNDLYDSIDQLDPTTSTVSQTYSFLPKGVALSSLFFAPDMSLAAGYSDTQVTLYNLTNQTSQVAYTLDRTCPFNKQNASRITSVAISPNDSQLAWSTNLQPCDTNKIDPTAPTDAVTTYDIATQKINKVWSGRRPGAISQILWPGTGQWVWLSSVELSQLLDLKSGQMYSVPKQREQNQGKDRVYFIGWLMGKK